MDLHAEAKVSIQAKVYRVAHDRRPFFIPTRMWIWLASKRVPGTVRMENLGTIASSDEGTAEARTLNA